MFVNGPKHSVASKSSILLLEKIDHVVTSIILVHVNLRLVVIPFHLVAQNTAIEKLEKVVFEIVENIGHQFVAHATEHEAVFRHFHFHLCRVWNIDIHLHICLSVLIDSFICGDFPRFVIRVEMDVDVVNHNINTATGSLHLELDFCNERCIRNLSGDIHHPACFHPVTAGN